MCLPNIERHLRGPRTKPSTGSPDSMHLQGAPRARPDFLRGQARQDVKVSVPRSSCHRGQRTQGKAAWSLTNGATNPTAVFWRPPAKHEEFIRPISTALVTQARACALTQEKQARVIHGERTTDGYRASRQAAQAAVRTRALLKTERAPLEPRVAAPPPTAPEAERVLSLWSFRGVDRQLQEPCHPEPCPHPQKQLLRTPDAERIRLSDTSTVRSRRESSWDPPKKTTGRHRQEGMELPRLAADAAVLGDARALRGLS